MKYKRQSQAIIGLAMFLICGYFAGMLGTEAFDRSYMMTLDALASRYASLEVRGAFVGFTLFAVFGLFLVYRSRRTKT